MGSIHVEPLTACGDETECYGGNREGRQSFHSISTKEENLEDSYLYSFLYYCTRSLFFWNERADAAVAGEVDEGKIKDFDFLSPAEKRIIEEHANNEREEGVDVILVASDLREFKLNLRRWVMGTSPLYILVSGWNKVVKECRLEEGNKIRLWSFHVNDQLYIAMVPLSPTESG
ncbi:predicted protein, partial [Arabidopsis lyrata subsp. lyrata]